MKQLLKKTTLIILFLTPLFISAQKWTDNVKFGFGGGAFFGNGYSYVNISPSVAYIFSDNFMAGVNVPLYYVSETILNKNIKSVYYGLSPFANYFIGKNFYLHAELENLSVPIFNPIKLTNDGRKLYSTPLIGAGYFQRNANFGGAYMQVLYIPNYNAANTYYNSPLVFRVGFFL